MLTPFAAALAELDATERGFVLGALLLGTADDVAVTAPLLSPSRERCAEALAALRALPRADRLRATGAMAREAMAAFPAGIDQVAVEHLEETLAGESAEILRVVARDAPACVRLVAQRLSAEREETTTAGSDATVDMPRASDAAVAAEIQRAALATIVAVPPCEAASSRWALRLAALPSTTLLAQVVEEGRSSGGVGDSASLARTGARAIGLRIGAQETGGLGATELAHALRQRLPRAVGEALVDAALAAFVPEPETLSPA
ncbi:MAG TPA: hypothetical protein VGP07_21980 [Polyangia bacterium]|jgi:hypothetical protein